MKKIGGAQDLDDLYARAEEADKSDFAKMRTGLQLVGGLHYNQKGSRSFDRIRTTTQLEESVRIRLTKNHIGRIARRYSNIIMTAVPGVAVGPKNEREIQDIKAADLCQAIWEDGKNANEWESLLMQWSDDFPGIGEVVTNVYFDEFAGPLVGHEQAVDEMGQPVHDEMGQPVKDEGKPVYQGQIKFEEVFGFNLLCDPQAQSIKDSPWHCIRKTVTVDDLQGRFPKFKDKIQPTGERPFLVFDVSGGYRKAGENEILVKYWYIKPCPLYPSGYFYVAITGIILDEGELPGGVYPIVVERFESIQTKRRGISLVEPLRPYNAEINRSASKIAEHQITLGDDKLIMTSGAKMSAGGQVPGIRGVSVAGNTPIVLPGRSGSQYVDYMLSQIKEMYEIAEISEEELQANLEPHTLLYRSATQKRKFSRYITKFEQFLKGICKTYLAMAKVYFDENMFVSAVGRNEAVNIKEFKNSQDISVQIVVQEQSDDVESKLGKQLTFQHILQYVGPQLQQDAIGKIIGMMPYSDSKEAFSDLTIDNESATNDILALDRGEDPVLGQFDNHEYLIKRATARMRQSDYKMLPPEIQQNYGMYVQAHDMKLKEQQDAIQRANSGFIPDGGALIGADYFIQDSQNPERTRRARFPYDAIDWLAKKLEEQGSFRRMAETLPPEAVAMTAGASPHMVSVGQDGAPAGDTPQGQPGGGAEIVQPQAGAA
jgi:hypothetical protein